MGDSTVMACTTDYGKNAFALWRSTDAKRMHWRRSGFIFPRGHKPKWALRNGRWWAPDLERFGNRWRVYFAAETAQYGTAIGVAWSYSLNGPWQSKLLHWRGQFNATSEQQETYGGVIDPGEAKDPDGQRYLVWSEQATSIWIAPLANDGLSIQGNQVYMALYPQPPWDCDAYGCCTEGSALLFHQGRAYILYSVRSTWHGTYAMRAAWSFDPLAMFDPLPGYILQSGPVWKGTGGGQTPVRVGGKLVEFYHAMRHPSYRSNARMAMGGILSWDGLRPTISP